MFRSQNIDRDDEMDNSWSIQRGVSNQGKGWSGDRLNYGGSRIEQGQVCGPEQYGQRGLISGDQDRSCQKQWQQGGNRGYDLGFRGGNQGGIQEQELMMRGDSQRQERGDICGPASDRWCQSGAGVSAGYRCSDRQVGQLGGDRAAGQWSGQQYGEPCGERLGGFGGQWSDDLGWRDQRNKGNASWGDSCSRAGSQSWRY